MVSTIKEEGVAVRAGKAS